VKVSLRGGVADPAYKDAVRDQGAILYLITGGKRGLSKKINFFRKTSKKLCRPCLDNLAVKQVLDLIKSKARSSNDAGKIIRLETLAFWMCSKPFIVLNAS
jgi:hypothetical protein